MRDIHLPAWIEKPRAQAGERFAALGLNAARLMLVGFLIGLAAIPVLGTRHYWLGLAFILAARVIAAIPLPTSYRETDAAVGAALDVIFFASVPFAFALADPSRALASAFLLFGFATVCAVSFTFPGEKRGITTRDAIVALVAFVFACLFPSWFSVLAYGLGIACFMMAGAGIALHVVRNER